ncbi:hypothetical protein ACIZ1P_19250 [Pseudomonas guariconensis]|uniref:hypothetical protein n=1 Tax=Pseudomonas guariconensis TaxID=1288410 RepID=UPI003F68E5D7
MSDDNKKSGQPISLSDLAGEPLNSFREQAEKATASLYPAQEFIKSYREAMLGSSVLAQLGKIHENSFAASAARFSASLPGSALSKQLQEMRAQFAIGNSLFFPTEEMRAQLNGLGYKDYLGSVVSSSAAENFKRFADSVVSQSKGFAEMARAVTAVSPAIVSYQNSALYKFLSQESFRNSQQLDRLQADYEENFALVDVDDLGEPLELRPELEQEIISAVQTGQDFSELSSPAKKYFLRFWKIFWVVIGHASAVVTLVLAFQSMEDSVEAASSPEEIRQSVNCIAPEHRVYLEGCGVVTRDEVIVRAAGTKVSKELLRLPAKTMVDVLESDPSGWIHVSVRVGDKDIQGWISERYLLVY